MRQYALDAKGYYILYFQGRPLKLADRHENIGGNAGNVLLTEKQRERMETYESSFIESLPKLLELPKKTLARMVVDRYSAASEEKTSLYDYMLETMIEVWYFPSVDVPRELTKKNAPPP